MVRRRGGELPEEMVPSSSRQEVLMGFFALVALVVALNLAAVVYIWAYSPNRGYWLAAAKWQMLEDLEEPVDTLVLGDSSCNQALIPEVVDEILGGPTINLCTIGDMTVRLWDLETHKELFALRLPAGAEQRNPYWDFDFRCTDQGECWIAVPLTMGRLALYRLPYDHPPQSLTNPPPRTP